MSFTLQEVFELLHSSLFAYFDKPVTLTVEDNAGNETKHYINALTLIDRAVGEQLVERWGLTHADVRKAMEASGIDEEAAFPDENMGGMSVMWGRGRRRKTRRTKRSP